MEKCTESKENAQLLSSFSAKKARRGKQCAAFGCVLIRSLIVKAQLLGYIFFKFTLLPSEIECRCNLIKRQSNKDGLYVSSNTILCNPHILEANMNKSHLNFLIPGFALSQNLPDKTITAEQEKSTAKRQITVKSRHK